MDSLQVATSLVMPFMRLLSLYMQSHSFYFRLKLVSSLSLLGVGLFSQVAYSFIGPKWLASQMHFKI